MEDGTSTTRCHGYDVARWIHQQQLHTIQARIKGRHALIEDGASTLRCYGYDMGRLEGPEPQVRIYAYTDGNAEAGTSHSARD